MKNKLNGLLVICVVTVASSFLGSYLGNKVKVQQSTEHDSSETVSNEDLRFGDKIKMVSGFYKSCTGHVVGTSIFSSHLNVIIECPSVPDTTITTDLRKADMVRAEASSK
jgi:hypothetical protein